MGSVPLTTASAVLPSLNLTRTVPPPAPPAVTTWLLVRIRPSADRMTPEPSPPPVEVFTSIDTTEGMIALATAAMVLPEELETP